MLFSYMLEYQVAGNQYSLLLFNSEDILGTNLHMQNEWSMIVLADLCIADIKIACRK